MFVDAGIKSDVFSLQSLIAWLEKKNPAGTYCYIESGHCLLAQWVLSMDARAQGNERDNSYGYIVNGRPVNLSHFKNIAMGGGEETWTFGAALSRARAALAAQ